MTDEIIDSNAGSGTTERPTFLTVLCILTWVGSGLGAIMIWTGDNGKFYPMWAQLLIMLCNFATAYGAWEMWNLKKQGLLIYTAGEVLAFLLPLILVYAVLPPFVANFIGQFMILMSIFPIAFLVMYWLNAKHLK